MEVKKRLIKGSEEAKKYMADLRNKRKGNNKFIELKSRNNEKNKYLTTMVGYNKIMKASELEEDVYFFFSFTDGIYYWKYDRNIDLEIKKGGRYDRGCSEINDYAFIPVNILQKIII